MNICVFCGSAAGNNPVYASTATRLGQLIAERSHSLIYGGGNVGLMGILADAVLENKGEVVGIIPGFLMQREVGHKSLNRLEVVDSMHIRKKRMADLSDAFVAIPGGWGTLDELAEILTWRQLGLIHQPIGLLNVNHFFEPLLDQMRLMQDEGFLRPGSIDLIKVEVTADSLLERMESSF